MTTQENKASWNLDGNVITVSFAPKENTEILTQIQKILLENYHLPPHHCKMLQNMR